MFNFNKKSVDIIKDSNEKLNAELYSKQFFYKIIANKLYEENYIDFIRLFLNDYFALYLEKNYNEIKYIVINDIPHKIILLLLDLKFKETEE